MSLQTQLRLEAFYSFNQRFAKIRSKRIQKAVTRITGHMSSELMDIPEVDRLTTSQKASKVKRKKSKNDSNKKKPGHQSSNTGECKELLELQELVADADKEMRPMGRGRGRGRGGSGWCAASTVDAAAHLHLSKCCYIYILFISNHG